MVNIHIYLFLFLFTFCERKKYEKKNGLLRYKIDANYRQKTARNEDCC